MYFRNLLCLYFVCNLRWTLKFHISPRSLMGVVCLLEKNSFFFCMIFLLEIVYAVSEFFLWYFYLIHSCKIIWRHTYVGICLKRLEVVAIWYYGWIVIVKVKISALKVLYMAFLFVTKNNLVIVNGFVLMYVDHICEGALIINNFKCNICLQSCISFYQNHQIYEPKLNFWFTKGIYVNNIYI